MNTHFLRPHSTALSVTKCELHVADLSVMTRYYCDILGLRMILESHDQCDLGIGDDILLTLKHDPEGSKASSKLAGLFHIAFLLPRRADLAHFIVTRNHHIMGSADHMVSEAVYLVDPEGNGIEVYTDYPKKQWPTDAEGVVMDNLPLNITELMDLVTDTEWKPFPRGTNIGHLHLQVGDLNQSKNFYVNILGFSIEERLRGVLFLGSGGYHHHIATNVWGGRGLVARTPNTLGLHGYVIMCRDADVYNVIRENLTKAEYVYTEESNRLIMIDPWGFELQIVNK